MTAALATLEQRLLRGYQEQLVHYDRAVTILDRHTRDQNGPVNNNWAGELHAALRDVAGLDAAMENDKTAWRLAHAQPGPELRAVLTLVAERIGTLAAGVHRHIAGVEARRNQLLPEIDDMIQKRRMLQAYGKYGDRSPHAAKSH